MLFKVVYIPVNTCIWSLLVLVEMVFQRVFFYQDNLDKGLLLTKEAIEPRNFMVANL
jgi:hypothetical protein